VITGLSTAGQNFCKLSMIDLQIAYFLRKSGRPVKLPLPGLSLRFVKMKVGDNCSNLYSDPASDGAFAEFADSGNHFALMGKFVV